MRKIEVLRKKYPRFVYNGYFYKITGKNLEIFFDFEINPVKCPFGTISPQKAKLFNRVNPDIKFRPRIIIKHINKERLGLIGERALNNFLFHLGLMEIPTYWKATCSPLIEIRAGYLSKEQIKWWKWLILRGMGQFFYENQIDFRKPNFLKIKSLGCHAHAPRFEKARFFRNEKTLVPMGEGKDSIVTLEVLSGRKSQVDCFIVNPTKEHFRILKIAGIKNPVIAERKIDPTLLRLNQAGYLNGHTPVTAVISNLAVFAAALFGFGNVAMSCEKSADEGNVRYLNKTINHQWSKSSEFEKKFRDYLNEYLTKRINYFSFLRPLYEIQIAKTFSGFPKYFSVFLSCNEARKTKSGTKKPSGKWCGKCPKCLFVWTILYPFAEEKKLIKIFGKNLFEKKELLLIMKELIGEEETKPFECVGTKKETLIAFYLSLRSFRRRKVKLPPLLRYFEEEILPKYPEIEKESRKMLSSTNIKVH